jgi:hypothetical protein
LLPLSQHVVVETPLCALLCRSHCHYSQTLFHLIVDVAIVDVGIVIVIFVVVSPLLALLFIVLALAIIAAAAAILSEAVAQHESCHDSCPRR